MKPLKKKIAAALRKNKKLQQYLKQLKAKPPFRAVA